MIIYHSMGPVYAVLNLIDILCSISCIYVILQKTFLVCCVIISNIFPITIFFGQHPFIFPFVWSSLLATANRYHKTAFRHSFSLSHISLLSSHLLYHSAHLTGSVVFSTTIPRTVNIA